MLLIILEGNECNYKTTIANKLSKLLGFEVIKGSSFELSTKPRYELYDYFLKLTTLENKIIDRFIYSNYVYATLYKDFSILTNEQRAIIENLLSVQDIIIVYLHANHEVLKERIHVRGDEYVSTDKLADINHKYDEILKRSSLPILHINTEQLTSDQIVKMISRHI